MPKYVVFPNNEVRYGTKLEPKIAKAGDSIELTEEQAANMKGIVGTAAEAKKAETIAEAKKIVEEEERSKALAEAEAIKGKGK